MREYNQGGYEAATRGASGHYHYDQHENYSNEGFDDMMHPVSRCRRFERRYDFSTFNMSDYTSCENCRHFSADNRCMVNPKLM